MSVYLNQRTRSRNHHQIPIKYSRWGGKDCFDAKMCDFTQEGISFISDFPYLPETEIAIKMRKDDDDSHASVRWSKPEPHKPGDKPLYRVGAKFTKVI